MESAFEFYLCLAGRRRMYPVIIDDGSLIDVQFGAIVRDQTESIVCPRGNKELSYVVDSEPFNASGDSGEPLPEVSGRDVEASRVYGSDRL